MNYIPKVLLISPLPPPEGGIAAWTSRYMKWIKEKQGNVDIVNTALVGRRGKKINAKRNLLSEIKRSRRIFKDLRKKCKEFNPDVIHLNTSCSSFGIFRDYFCAKYVKKKGYPLIVHYRCNIQDQIKTNLQQRILKKLSNECDLNIVLNNTSKEYLKKHCDVISRKIPNFITEEYFLEGERKISPQLINIVYVGHVQQSKGVVEILTASKEFPKKNFYLAGPIHEEFNVDKDSLNPNIKFMGRINQNQVRDLLVKADAFVFPTYTEGFSNALLEAMAMSLPIITTDVGANQEMIEEHGGIIIPIKSAGSLIKAIEKLEDQDFRKSISYWNSNKARNYYHIDSIMFSIMDIYTSVIKKTSSFRK